MGWEGICIRVHLISASLSSQAERNKEWEAAKRIHGLVRKSFRAEHPAWMQSGCSHKVGLMWKKMAVTPLWGWERGEKKGRGWGGGKPRGEKESGTPWRRKVVRRTEASRSCDSEWDERGFWQYNFVSSLLPSPHLFTPLRFTQFLRASIWSDLASPSLFGFAVDLLFAANGSEGKKKRRTPTCCSACHFKISGSPADENVEINFLPHPPGACRWKKKQKKKNNRMPRIVLPSRIIIIYQKYAAACFLEVPFEFWGQIWGTFMLHLRRSYRKIHVLFVVSAPYTSILVSRATDPVQPTTFGGARHGVVQFRTSRNHRCGTKGKIG